MRDEVRQKLDRIDELFPPERLEAFEGAHACAETE